MEHHLQQIEDIAHRALNGSLKRPGSSPRVSDYKEVLRQIRDIAREACDQKES